MKETLCKYVPLAFKEATKKYVKNATGNRGRILNPIPIIAEVVKSNSVRLRMKKFDCLKDSLCILVKRVTRNVMNALKNGGENDTEAIFTIHDVYATNVQDGDLGRITDD